MAQRLREFRLLYLPRVVFVLGVVTVAILWRQAVAPPTLVAEAESETVDVRSKQAGVLLNLNVSAAQIVHAGDVLGQIIPPSASAAGTAPEQSKPVPLIAPIDGLVERVRAHAGDAVAFGEKVLRVESTRPKRLSGFIRQPLAFEPKPGMIAELRTESSPTQIAVTTITQVSATMQPIPESLQATMHLPPKAALAPALRVYFAIPKGFFVRPGELVDVRIR